ncbi:MULTISPECIES: hypothetical protein [unclassified Streptomyces]|uniref:hypothetical protein n=1 Tax=unclassified Streptomyces TaxID=2593676 RepID=UPI0028868751|nr:hypothetical protein [Streptomyces sp. DSM 41633]
MDDFDGVVRFLSSDVDWDASEDDSVVWRVGDFLREKLARHPSLVQERFSAIARSSKLMDELVPHSEFPHQRRDKFVLYRDPQERFVVRVHRFHPCGAGDAEFGPVHNHRYPAVTLLLKGSYEERAFRETSRDEEMGTAELTQVKTHSLARGDVDVKGWDQAHQVRNAASEEAAFTLFVRGPSIRRFADIYDVEQGTFRPAGGMHDLARVGFIATMLGSSSIRSRHEALRFMGSAEEWAARKTGMLDAATQGRFDLPDAGKTG